MFDFDAGKLLIIGVVALLVIGPKELPRVLRQVGQAVSRIRRMATDFQGQFMDAMREADLQDIREEMSKVTKAAELNVDFDPVRDVRRELDPVMRSSVAVEPALAATPSPAADFSLPSPAAGPHRIEDGETTAAAGLAPVVGEPDAATLPHPNVPAPPEPDAEAAPPTAPTLPPEAVGPKRVIVLPKRRGVLVPGRPVRVAAEPAGRRFRHVRQRRPEAVEQ